jgi:menaquinone-dependent protoporphyrinogen oxidase
MPNVLVLYASKHGQTAKVAAHVAEALTHDGVTADVREIHDSAEISPSDFDAVIVGASIHAGHHQRQIVAWAKRNASSLRPMPTAFFSLSLTAAEDTDQTRHVTGKYVDDFIDETGWSPGRTATFAGALQYREYNFATRLLMRLIMRRGGHPTDSSRDYDYTDWDAVTRFGHECAGVIGAALTTAA